MNNYSELHVNPNKDAEITNTMLSRAVKHLYLFGVLKFEDEQLAQDMLHLGLPVQFTMLLSMPGATIQGKKLITLIPHSPHAQDTTAYVTEKSIQINSEGTEQVHHNIRHNTNQSLQLWVTDTAKVFWQLPDGYFTVAVSAGEVYTGNGAETKH